MRALAPDFRPYSWATPTDEVAALAEIDVTQVIRFDQNTSPQPLASSRPGTIAKALAGINNYPPGGYKELHRAIADYNGVDPDNVTIGLGADDLILLCARTFAGPGEQIAIEPARTYPLYRMATMLAGAEVGDDEPVLTYTCRPNSPLGELPDLPVARPLVVDEAYYEYCGETALPLIEDGDVIVLRTFSKAFALAGARVGYALSSRELAQELYARQAPAPVTSLSDARAPLRPAGAGGSWRRPQRQACSCDRGDADLGAPRARRCESCLGADGRRDLRPLPRAARVPRWARPDRRGDRRPRDGRPPHGGGHRARTRRGARPRARRP